jgi:hypothetical protein
LGLFSVGTTGVVGVGNVVVVGGVVFEYEANGSNSEILFQRSWKIYQKIGLLAEMLLELVFPSETKRRRCADPKSSCQLEESRRDKQLSPRFLRQIS